MLHFIQQLPHSQYINMSTCTRGYGRSHWRKERNQSMSIMWQLSLHAATDVTMMKFLAYDIARLLTLHQYLDDIFCS